MLKTKFLTAIMKKEYRGNESVPEGGFAESVFPGGGVSFTAVVQQPTEHPLTTP